MGWLGVLKLLLHMVAALAVYMKNKQLLDSGRADQILKNVRESDELLSSARDARDNAVNDFDKRGVPDESDPNLRD